MDTEIELFVNKIWQLGKDEGIKKWKYSPVAVANNCTLKDLTKVKNLRKKLCQDQSYGSHASPIVDWSFEVDPPIDDSTVVASPQTAPVFVISANSANTLANYLNAAPPLGTPGERLAWDPDPKLSRPVYIFVHHFELSVYKAALGRFLSSDRRLVGWKAGNLTGFGITRAAVLQFADTLASKPDRIIMMDQNVVDRTKTSLNNPKVETKIDSIHGDHHSRKSASKPPAPSKVVLPVADETQRRVVGYGLGSSVPTSTKKIVKQKAADATGPTQQMVSIYRPFIPKDNADPTQPRGHHLYPAYMVAGGEDMVMSAKLGQYAPVTIKNHTNNINVAVRKQQLQKLDMPPIAQDDKGFSGAKLATLTKLHDEESKILVWLNDPISGTKTKMSIGAVADLIVRNYRKDVCATPEAFNGELKRVSACIIERIIVKRYTFGKVERHAEKGL